VILIQRGKNSLGKAMDKNVPVVPGGYILIARKLFESDLMNKPHLYIKLWVWMLHKANFKDRDKLKRGQLFTTIEEMRKVMGYRIGYRTVTPTKDEIRSAYEAFTKATMITTAKTTRGMIITICNYEHYQNMKNYEAHNEPHNENTAKPTDAPHYTERKIKNVRNIRPTIEDVSLYCRERNNGVDPHQWLNHYTANGWKVGKNPMKDWKAAVRTWEKNKLKFSLPQTPADDLFAGGHHA
jgi:hypothetical protein